jgi:deoxyribonuclease V
VNGWPDDTGALAELQHRLAEAADAALAAAPWSPGEQPLLGGCFVAFARGEAGPGKPGDRAWAAAVVWRAPPPTAAGTRSVDRHLRGMPGAAVPRRADDVVAQAVVAGRVGASYLPGFLALREGPLLADAVAALERRPDVLLVDATGADHPRGAGLAVHLGAVVGLPTVGVTQRPLVATGPRPDLVRGAWTPLHVGGRHVASWVCTRTGARPVLAHAGWRTTAPTATATVLLASTPAARAPVPLQEARRVAREARSLAAP